MAAPGLLQGFGRGLSQAAGMLQQGMSEDRAVELQRMREESIARRWKRQEDREDARYKSEQEYRQGRDKAMDDRMSRQEAQQQSAAQQAQKNADRSFGLQERQLSESTALRKSSQIESNLSGLFSASDKADESITKKYERLMRREGITEAEFKTLNQQFTDEIAASRKYYNDKVTQYAQSYGDSLKGTGFEFLLHMKPDAATNTNSGEIDPLARQAVLNDLAGGNSHGRGDLVDTFISGGNSSASAASALPNTTTSPSVVPPGFSAGFGSMGVNPSTATDLSDASPLESGLTRAGQAAKLATDGASLNQNIGLGLLSLYNQNFIQPAVDWLNTKPSQRPRPGETPQQFAARTGIKK